MEKNIRFAIENNIAKIDFAKYLSMENITEYVKGVISVASGIFDVFVTIIISIYILTHKKVFVKRGIDFCRNIWYTIS